MILPHNPSCRCWTTPKADEEYVDWTVRSAETKARFGRPQTQDSPKARCRWCLLEMMGGVEHPVWHDDGTAYEQA